MYKTPAETQAHAQHHDQTHTDTGDTDTEKHTNTPLAVRLGRIVTSKSFECVFILALTRSLVGKKRWGQLSHLHTMSRRFALEEWQLVDGPGNS